MAKELPYFKFEPSEWQNGDIQMFSFIEKGIFVELCCAYWSKLGTLKYKLAIQLCGGNTDALDSLYEEGLFEIKNGFIKIKFLDEQLSEFENISKQNAENARKGWEKRKNNATAERPQSNRNAIREDKKRKEKIIEDENKKESSTEKSENFSGVEKYKWVTFDIEVQNTFYEILNFFPEHLRPTTKTEEKKWLETIDKLHRIDKVPYELIIKIVKLVRADDWWNKNFLSLTKLRKKNPDGVKYIVVFSEKFLKNGKKEQQGGSSELRQRVAKGLGIIQS